MNKKRKKKEFSLYEDLYIGLKQAIAFEKGQGYARVHVHKFRPKEK